MKQLRLLLAVGVLCVTTACAPVSKQESNRVSKDRLPGSSCSEHDSASVKRALWHPEGPTGGWNNHEHSSVNYSRTKSLKSNCLIAPNSTGFVSGYVKFDTPGTLRIRSYDDYYGDVYCGWSPYEVKLKPTDKYVYVCFDQCSVGDGGLDQVHEVSWFPEGSEKGTILFSSAHPASESQLDIVDVYQQDWLGSQSYVNEYLTKEVLQAYAKRRDLESARKVVDHVINLLSQTKAVSAKGPVPSEEFQADFWAWLLAYKLGSTLEQPGFEPTLSNLSDVVNLPANKSNREFEYKYREFLPVYAWLNNELSGKPQKKLTVVASGTQVSGYDAVALSNYLQSDRPDSAVGDRYAFNEFWFGAKNYLRGDYNTARDIFSKFLNGRAAESHPFESASSARLIELMPSQSSRR